MGLPGVTLNVLDGNLGLQPGSNQNVMLWMGCCLNGTPNTMYQFGDPTTASNTLVGGELYEAVGYSLRVAPGIVMAMPLNPTTRGGAGSVTHIGTGAGTVTVSLAPQASITITCTTGGTIGTAAFTFKIGNGTASAPVTSAAGWTSTGYLVPGTYTTVVFTAGTYVAGGTPDIYVISTLGAVTHPQGTGPTVPTFTSSPVDYYTPLITIQTAGAVGTATFTYSLDNGVVTSATVITASSYAIPNTGIVLAFASTFVSGDTYSFSCAPPTFTNTDLTNALTALETTYLNQAFYSQVAVVGSVASAAAWATQVATLETAAGTLFGSGIYVNFFAGGPTVGTVLPNAGSVTIDSADTDSVVITARQGMSAKDVVPCAGDGILLSPVTGLSLRRNALWGAAARAALEPASEDIGATADGAIASYTSIFRDENATPGFYAAGITCLRTFSGLGLNGIFVTKGLTATVSTSDYFPLTNERVINQACAIARLNTLSLINSKIPTQTRNGIAGTIREDAAQNIESHVTAALIAGLVSSSPQNAVAAKCVVVRTNNIYATGNLILNVSVQPFGYATTITVNVGMTLSAS